MRGRHLGRHGSFPGDLAVEPQLVNFTVHVDGTYLSSPELPGFAAPSLALAAALGVAWRRRR